ncbi:hypothetical protein ACFQ34_04165 [Pseudonocardia benzenivorans]|uniref:Uncharacterized protein n=1 Tax=Pseudonocardia benzenivorans TaxID=228005 RepID=A0ABW3VDW1_9PSEU|nr:hypothetical protein PSD17_43420 [Pseudonocardia sp. D17]
MAVPLPRGLDREEATRALANFAAEFPDMSEPELYAWIIERLSTARPVPRP